MSPVHVIPREIREADLVLQRIHQKVVFSHFLNPRNVGEARVEFLRGRSAPPFVYEPASWAQEVLELLEHLVIPRVHAWGPILAQAAEESRVFTLALRDRTPEAFGLLSQTLGWDPDAALLEAAASILPADVVGERFEIDARSLCSRFRAALSSRGLDAWRVELDSVQSARVMVDSARHVVRVHPTALFRSQDPERLVAHEIDVHVTRAHNGEQQPLSIFATGLPGSLETEEGLALAAEDQLGLLSQASIFRQALVVLAIPVARESSFRDLFRWLCEVVSPQTAWTVALRLKRGLASPDSLGVYAKDGVYFRGFRRVRAWLDRGANPEVLYVGKVGIGHPVDRWIDEGLIQPFHAPSLWWKSNRRSRMGLASS